MEQTLWKWFLEIPQYIGQFAGWLMTPIKEYMSGNWFTDAIQNISGLNWILDMSPLGLLGLGGVTAMFVIIGIHFVRMIV